MEYWLFRREDPQMLKGIDVKCIYNVFISQKLRYYCPINKDECYCSFSKDEKDFLDVACFTGILVIHSSEGGYSLLYFISQKYDMVYWA